MSKADRIPLDEVMLAMDVVDTLRHQQTLIEGELDGEARSRRLVERIQSIYESQGIEVDESVVTEGVKALEEDRFVYTPPERSFSVWLAEVYVARWKWFFRLLILTAIVGATWACFAIPAYFEREAQREYQRQSIMQLRSQFASVADSIDGLGGLLANAARKDDPAAAKEILADVDRRHAQLQESLVNARTGLRTALEQPAGIHSDVDRTLEPHRRSYEQLTAAVGAARGQLDALAHLRSLRTRVHSVLDRLAGVEVDESTRRELGDSVRALEGAIDDGRTERVATDLDALEARVSRLRRAHLWRRESRQQVKAAAMRVAGMSITGEVKAETAELLTSAEAALAAADQDLLRRELGRLENLIDALESEYELRIATGRNQRSGMWRHPNGQRNKKNFYVIVNAVTPRGKRLRLPIRSEESHRTSRVSTFGIRVPESVYEQVKADKLDNGIIDNEVFGTKRRGTLVPEYRFTVTGGMITKW